MTPLRRLLVLASAVLGSCSPGEMNGSGGPEKRPSDPRSGPSPTPTSDEATWEWPVKDGWSPSGSQGIDERPDGSLGLESRVDELGTIWIANSAEDTVSKVDTRTGQEIARYPSGGRDPSRTAVDPDGDVYVGNRGDTQQPSLTKIAGVAERCLDRDASGAVDTSTGASDVRADDECVLWTVPIGSRPSTYLRALAVAPSPDPDGAVAGNVWVGVFEDRQVHEVDGATGEVLRTIDLQGLTPYGAAIDREGTLWLASRDGPSIARVSTETGEVRLVPIEGSACVQNYGIAIDGAGRVWLGGWNCTTVHRFDPATGGWIHPAIGTSTRGVAATLQGTVWVARDVEGAVSELDADSGALLRTIASGGAFTVGMAIDFAGLVWTVNRDSNDATRIDPSSGETRLFPVGTGPYTYSDMTGFQLRHFGSVEGWVRWRAEGCADAPTPWQTLDWDADVPAGGSVEARVRAADDATELAAAQWSPLLPGPPADLAALGLGGTILEVEMTLRSGGGGASPLLHWVALTRRECPERIE